MRLLLDTHIWLWSISEPSRLSARVAKEIRSPGNELWLSPVSVWEALTLQEKGRISAPADANDWVARGTAPFREAPLTWEIAALSSRLLPDHRDPADRLIVATAAALRLTLVTADRSLLGLGTIATLANR